MSAPSNTRCAIVAIIGAPNAGKSTLVNQLVGEKVSIVTHKAQTTRFALRGVAMRGRTQLVLVDTPGVFAPKRRLDRAMVGAAFSAAADADAIVHVVDAPAFAARGAQARDDISAIIDRLKEHDLNAFLALNKVDAIVRPKLLDIAKHLFDEGVYAEVFMIAAVNGDGVEDLAAALVAAAPEGPFLFEPDQAADAPARLRAAEITREKLMLRLHEELPYELMVETEAWRAQRNGLRIDQTIYVARESQKKIVIGAGGETLKAIGQAARAEIAQMMGGPVHLFLHVKVRARWSEDRAHYRALGLDWDA